MTVPGNLSSPLLATATGAAAAAEYVIPKSLRFNDDDQAYLAKTVTSVGDQRRMTFSFWIKRHSVSSSSGFAIFAQDYLTSPSNAVVDRSLSMLFDGDRLELYDYGASSGAGDIGSVQAWTAGVVQEGSDNVLFRDPSAWYSVIFAIDTTQSTAANRCKVWINGVQRTMSGYPVQNSYLSWGQAKNHYIGIQKTNGSFTRAGDFSLADVHFIDGQQLSNTDFGEFDSNGIWRPKEYTGSYNPPVDQTQTWSSALSDSTGFASGYGATKAFDGIATADNTARASATNTTTTFQPATDIAYTSKVEVWTYFSGSVSLNGGSAVTVSNDQDWRTIATGSGTLDTLTFTGSSSYVYLGGIRIDGVLLVDPGVTVPHNGFHLNFSDSSTIEALGFDSAPTTPDPDPKKGMDVVAWTGNGSTQNIGGLNFEPGLVWIKQRTTVEHHALYDTIRGATNQLYSNLTNAETAQSTTLTAFNPDGFSVGSDDKVNENGNSHVAWTWRAGGPAVSKTAGTIDAEVSASTDYGFSICKFTGTGTAGTIEHGLSTVPKWYMVKNLDTSPSEWNVFHVSTGETKRLKLNSNSAAQTASNSWNDTAPTASLFTVGTDTDVNKSGDEHIAYLWSEVSGYSKFGTYEGASTVTVTTGFKPRWILLKNVDASGSWSIFDSERDSDLEINHRIYANEDSAEGTNTVIGNFTDTGFTLTNQGNSNWNTTGDTFVYAAFADRPGNNWGVNNIVTNEGLTTSKTQFDVVKWTGNGGALHIGAKPSSGAISGSGTPANASGTGGWAQAFDGSTSTLIYVSGGVGTVTSKLTLPSPISFTKLRIYAGQNATSGTNIQANDVNLSASHTWALAGSWVDVTSSVTSPLTSLALTTVDGNSSNIRAIEIDDVIVVESDGPGLNFQPDFVWIKDRSNSYSNRLANSVRGSTRVLFSDQTNAEQVNEYGTIDSFNSDGFTLRQGSNNNGDGSNTNNANMVAWCWKAGGTAVSNTDGSITSSVSANAQYGFSVGTYTGTYSSQPSSLATVGHGLNGKVPGMIISKSTNGTSNWHVWHRALDNDEYIRLNSTNAKATLSTGAGGSIATAPTGSVFPTYYIGGSNNGSSDNLVFYCFADVPGYQRVGVYTGNGSSTGPVVVTGFKPRFLLIKRTDAVANWYLLDTERDSSNPVNALLRPNISDAEISAVPVDILQSGFQPKDADFGSNASGGTYMYLAIGDDEIGSDEDCLVDVPNAVTADADATDTTGGYQRGNYATLNPLQSALTLTNGNLSFNIGTRADQKVATATIHISSGKWYWEVTSGTNNDPAGANTAIGIRPTSVTSTTQELGYNDGGGKAYFSNGGTRNGDSSATASYGASFGTGDVISVAFDADNGTLEFYKNGVSQGTAFTGLTGTWAPAVGLYTGQTQVGTDNFHINFGQMRFKYPMPSGYAAINTSALPAATIADGSAQFDAKRYTGASGSVTVTTEFGPDFVWLKNRSHADGWHQLRDAVRGGDRNLSSNADNAESDASNKDLDFNSDGFTLTGTTDSRDDNYDGDSYIAWAWNAGANSNKTYTVKVVSDSGNKYRFDDFGTSAVTLNLAEGSTYVFDQSDSSNSGHPLRFSTTSDGTHGGGSEYTTGVTATGTPGSAGAKTTIVVGSGVATLYYYCTNHSGMGGQANTNSTVGASNFDGSIQTTVKANPEAGFSIVSFTAGSSGSYGHGLNAEPSAVIFKNRDTAGKWRFYHKDVGTSKTLFLNTTEAETSSSERVTAVSSSTFTAGGTISGDDHIAYCFAPVTGFSAFGSYSSNQSTDGPFIHLGFRPRWILLKASVRTYGSNWSIIDTARNSGNFSVSASGTNILYASTSGAEFSSGGAQLDILSNGFKIRNNSSDNNDNGTYIYAAFSENAFSLNGGLAF